MLLEAYLKDLAKNYSTYGASSLLQIFSAVTEENYIRELSAVVRKHFPDMEIVGTTTVGEIMEGALYLGSVVLSFTFFEQTRLYCYGCDCEENQEYASGQKILHTIRELDTEIAGVLLLATTLTLATSKIFEAVAMDGGAIGIPFFGGGAGGYETNAKSWVFYNGSFFYRGLVCVVFLGSNLQISLDYNFGWQPLGRVMSITESDGMVVKKVDGMDAFELYHRYLNIGKDKDFFQNVLEFPFMVDRDGHSVARVPFFARKDNSIEFVADIVEGESFRLGYGDPDSIIESARKKRDTLRNFEPDAVFLYACICRRFLLQSDVNLETGLFAELAPTSGFFTSGEFYALEGKAQVLNSTIVIVGMREVSNEKKEKRSMHCAEEPMKLDAYSGKHNRIVSRLLYFIGSLSRELEEANSELLQLSETDKLTGAANRLKLDRILSQQIYKSSEGNGGFSVILIDIDFFKKVNDEYGHMAGDLVLKVFTEILRENVRTTDTVGRWGGEEFLLILPGTSISIAAAIAETLRLRVEDRVMPGGIHITCSLGTAEYRLGERAEDLIKRVDDCLYEAKANGRNCMVYHEL